MMITHKMLEEWRQAKNLAVTSLNIEPEIAVAVQEMYIEAKQLRKDNIKLLNMEGLIEKLAEYVRVSRERHYTDPEMDEILDDILYRATRENLDLEIFNE